MTKVVQLNAANVKGFLGDMEAPELPDDYAKVLGLSKYQNIRRWELGVYNDATYVLHILQYEFATCWRNRLNRDSGTSFDRTIVLSGADIDYLVRNWRGVTDKNDKGDRKELTYDKLQKAIATLESKEVLLARSQQLSLSFSFEVEMVDPDE